MKVYMYIVQCGGQRERKGKNEANHGEMPVAVSWAGAQVTHVEDSSRSWEGGGAPPAQATFASHIQPPPLLVHNNQNGPIILKPRTGTQQT